MVTPRKIATRISLLFLVLLLSPVAGSVSSAKSEQISSIPALLEQVSGLQTEPISETETLFEVYLTEEGIFPPVLTLPPGATIRWTNQTSQTQRIEGAWSAVIPDAEAGVFIFLPLITKGSIGDDNNLAADSALPNPDASWQSGDIPPGDSFSRIFDQPGHYSYVLADAPNMTGSLIIPSSSSTPATLSTLTVTTTADDRTTNSNCTLREAIIAANTNTAVDACPAGNSADTIILAAGVYTLTVTGAGEDAAAKGDLDIKSKITITSADSGPVIINAVGLSDRVFHVLDQGTLTISNLSIIKGQGFGGGIYNRGALTLNRSTISGNAGGNNIGGGFKNDGQATFNASTISGNTADSAAGIYNRGILTLNNSTVSGNIADSQGGGIKNEGTLSLHHTTVASNTARFAGGIRRHSGTVTFKNSIIAGNIASEGPARADCDNISTGSLGYNLVGKNTGCPTTSTDLKIDPAQIFTTVLGPLQNNGGPTFTHALLPASPAINAIPLDKCAFTTDQRGIARPQGPKCDIGSFEFEEIGDPAQTGPIFTVNTTQDPGDGVCSLAHCTLREAINAANLRPNNAAPDEIRFNISATGLQTIQPTSALPPLTNPLKIDGTTQPGATCDPINLLIELNGSSAGPTADGLTISAGNSTVRGLVIRNFSDDGIELTTAGNNIIRCNTVTANGGDGVQVSSSTGNAIGGTLNPAEVNRIFDNTGLGINLAVDTVTPNDPGDPDAGANNLQNFPVVTGAFANSGDTLIDGRLNSTAATTFTLEFFANPACDPSGFGEGQTFLGSRQVATDASGDAIFTGLSLPTTLPVGQFVTATATDPGGNTSEFSQCRPVGLDNDSWPRALGLTPNNTASFDQFIDMEGQSRWFKFPVQPNSQVIVTLTNLPENYDLTLYKDIRAAFNELTAPGVEDLVQLNAEFANDAFAADAIARGSRSPDAFARGSRSPDAFAVGSFSPDAIARGSRSPDAFARGSRSPDAFSPDAFAPDAYTPDAFARGSRSPDALARGSRSPEAYSSAQTRSLIGISAFESTASEGIIANTWNNTGDFYVRVRGRNGAFSLAAPFYLEVTLVSELCNNVNTDNLPPRSSITDASGYKTIILTDLDRMEGTTAEKAALQDRLNILAARPEVAGVVVNVGANARVAALNDRADTNFACPYAKNLVATAIKEIVDGYRALNPLEYVVIIGNDEAIPFFRHPDRAALGPESDFIPPVSGLTASEASLRLDYVLGQDAYGSQVDLSFQASALPIPDLAVGRLVETPTDVIEMLDAYLSMAGGVAPTPATALVTGYDFFADAAVEIQDQLERGIGLAAGGADALITARDVPPQDPNAWTADDLSAALLGSRHDLIFLGGHFSASSALAADYQTRLLSTDLTSSPVNLENALIFSIGCHSGYNIINEHGIPQITFEPDWAQAFARKGATLIAGTGYQYGDTDFLEYSERIYLEFSRQLRAGSGPVAVGKALVAAKQIYLAQTPQMRSLHEKSLLEATLFGLPMFSINMTGERFTPPPDTSIVTSVNSVGLEPGASLGLKSKDVTISSSFVETTVQLEDVTGGLPVEAIYLSGSDGAVTNVGEPALPLEVNNVTAPDNLVLRGVGFHEGSYLDTPNVNALVGAPTTEIRSIHTPFVSDIFYPIQPWSVNYFDALAEGAGGKTYLNVTPAQFISSTPGSETNILRQFGNMAFRLYYSNNTASFGAGGTPALAAPPAIVRVSAIPNGGQVDFKIEVVGDPVAGMQEVWITYTVCPTSDSCNGSWQSLDLTQNINDTILWEGSLILGGTNAADIRYIVQAANGVGLVSLATNLGAYYIPGVEAAPLQPTALSLENGPSSGPYGSEASFSAVLTDQNGDPLADQIILFALGAQAGLGMTDSSGQATTTIPLLGLPGEYEVRASFAGTATDAPSSATNTFLFDITKQNTALCLEPPSASDDDTCQPQPISGRASDDRLVVATLTDALGNRLFEKTVVFVVSGSGGSHRETVITDYAGRASLGNLPLPPGDYTINAFFNGVIPLGNGNTVTLDDQRYNPASATGSLTLTNAAPVAVNDSYSVNEDTTLTVAAPGVLGNDTDADNMSLTAILVSGPGHGTLNLNPNGSFSYTPAANFNGADTFTYKANDGIQDSNTATVTITIQPINDAPVAVNDAYSVDQNNKLIVAAPGVLANDTDIDSASLTAALVSGPSHGSLTLKASGAFTYIPFSGFTGTDSFTYKASDGSLNSNVATVTITVKPKPLDCSAAQPNPAIIWEPNNKFKAIKVVGLGNPNANITIVSIFQDERVGKDKYSPDGKGIGTNTAQIRAERSGTGNGRVYHISFTATDGQGGSCSGKVRVAVPHDQDPPIDLDAIDGGPLYNSTVAQ